MKQNQTLLTADAAAAMCEYHFILHCACLYKVSSFKNKTHISNLRFALSDSKEGMH